MKFNFRKIASVLASTVMVSSTAALALAANYPSPFVKSGMTDVAVVWGTTAANTDLVAVTDITASLQAELTKQAPTSSTTSDSTSITGGDFVKLEKSSDKLNLGDTMSGVFGATVDDDDLEVLLADGTYLNDENTEFDYEQKLTLFARQLTQFADSNYKDKEPTVGFHVASSSSVLNYSLDFTTDAESDVASGDLVDFETTNLNILGRNYYILDADNGTNANYLGKFTLLDAASSAIVTEGETQTVTVGSKSFEVSINFISSTSTKLEVNGQVTNSLASGETYRLSDGTYVGIKDILYNSKDTGISKVEFSLGSGKLEIDTGTDIELNDESIDGMKGWFTRGTESSGKQKVDKIIIQWSNDDEVFIAPGSDVVMPGFGAVKFSMGGFIVPNEEITKVDADGDDSIELNVPIKDGIANFNILQANASGEFILIGKDSDERLATTGGSVLTFNETLASNNYHKWFVATYNTSDDGESYLLTASISENNNRNRTSIKNVVTGETVCADKVATDTCNIGDVSLTITGVDKSSTAKGTVLTAGSNTNFNTLYTATGLKIYLPYGINGTDGGVGAETDRGAINLTANVTGSHSTTVGHSPYTFYLFMQGEDKDDNKGAGPTFNVTLDDDSDGDVHVSAVNTGSTNHEIKGTDDDTVSRVVADVSSEVKRYVSSDKGRAEINYPGKETYAEVYVTDVSASVSGSGGTTELGSVSVKDSEVASVSSKNLIVVGGSCVNTVAAELLGLPSSSCGDAFTSATGVGSDQFLIQTFSSKWASGKIATLVAGYNAQDTTNAAKYLTTQTVDTSASKKYVGTSATTAELVTV